VDRSALRQLRKEAIIPALHLEDRWRERYQCQARFAVLCGENRRPAKSTIAEFVGSRLVWRWRSNGIVAVNHLAALN